MKARMNPYTVSPEALKLTIDYNQKLAELGLEPSLQEPRGCQRT
ncbi:alkylhydroperoxidase [Cystobacter fuscus]|uniref:Alkylhydroperoxidase n=1 Tax=Cystobacter fuscus TaxID=43 RepID=A0A250JMH4_9BACT|nr:hypothetical protein [Cystobacter fuscus]ATB44306.1 alkylhydroperoxidase [Cystobacter fuscus]